MSLPASIRDRLVLPAICAPMFLVSGPRLVIEACKAGVIGGLPAANARDPEGFAAWMNQIARELGQAAEADPKRRIAPLAVNLSLLKTRQDVFEANLAICKRHRVSLVITAVGDPTEAIKRVHDYGGLVFHDVTTMRHAEKAIAAGVDGLTVIGWGGGGHSGTLNHFAFVEMVRAIFDGTIVLAGSVSTGRAIRAAEVLGADLAYLGTRFIATRESMAPESYKQFMVADGPDDVVYTPAVTGVPANFLKNSIRRVGLDPDRLPQPKGVFQPDLPGDLRAWRDIWSAGQGIGLIDDIPTVAELVQRLKQEYEAARALP